MCEIPTLGDTFLPHTVGTVTVWWEADVLHTHKRSTEGVASAALRTLETTGTLHFQI